VKPANGWLNTMVLISGLNLLGGGGSITVWELKI